eukprot:TRINITY_DN38675_c0_g1_i1.p1 TRINITY_DN38675_c0_g1~~TRINITY_DN38675_c0_g1_i1.p1  ORF type:complete len:585 (+),score=131.49 TRINITY_DN38675_c0_g1_i1:103-1857(+)
MDSWLKAKAEELARVAQSQVDELQQSASKLVSTSARGQRKALEFGEGPLGFTLEGTLVVSVEAGSQASELGVEVGDRLLQIDGYNVPISPPGDVAGEQRANKVIQKWLRKMPRPGELSFASPDFDQPELCHDSAEATTAPVDASSPLDAIVVEENPLRVAAELRETKQTLFQVRASLDMEKRKANKLLQEVGFLRERSKELLLAANARETDSDAAFDAAEIRASAMQAEIDRLRDEVASRENLDVRCSELQNEVVSLRDSLDVAKKFALEKETELDRANEVIANLRQELESEITKASALDARANAAESRGKALVDEIAGLRNAHDAEMELLVEENNRQAAAQKSKADEQEKKASLENDRVRCELGEARRAALEYQASAASAAAEAHTAVLEASAARAATRAAIADAEAARAAAAAAATSSPVNEAFCGGANGADTLPANRVDIVDGLVPPSSLEEGVAAWRARAEFFEQRCSTLQRKLTARIPTSIVGQAGAGQSHPTWLPWVLRVAGPRVGELSLLAFTMPSRAMRSFTGRLLERDALLWVFYAHLLILYLIAASYVLSSPAAHGSLAADLQLRQPGAIVSPT